MESRTSTNGITLEQFSAAIAGISAASSAGEHWSRHAETARQSSPPLTEVAAARLALASLDCLAVASFIVDAQAEPKHSNAAARALLASGDCVRIVNARLRFAQRGSNTQFDEALRSATQSPWRATVLPVPAGAQGGYEVSVSSLHNESESAGGQAGGLALAAIATLIPDAERVVQRARRLYGLTDAEASVMAAVAGGRTVEEIASKHRVRLSTVRAQVRSIFEKTGVHRQSDLVRLALTGAPRLTAR